MFEKQRINLGCFPTPIQPLPNSFTGQPVYLKRDDLSDHGLGGNKLRKLEYLVHDAINQGYDTLLTVGGPQTNHGRLTAAVATKIGLKCVLILSGNEPEILSGNLILDTLLGAEIVFLNGQEQQLVIKETIKRYESANHRVYSIPLGGSNPVGAMGYFSMMEELADQLPNLSHPVKHLVVTAGSLGTLAGIVLGNKYFGLDLKIHGIKIFPADAEQDIEFVLNLCAEASKKFVLGVEITRDDFIIHTHSGESPFYKLGYNIPDPDTRKVIRDVASSEGIFLDPTYTGKGFAGMIDLMQAGLINSDDGCLFIHTGGIPSLLSIDHVLAMQQDLKLMMEENRVL